MSTGTPSPSQPRPRSLAELLEHLRLAWYLLRDRRVDLWLRAGVPALVAAYVLMPIDLLPDVIPVLGQVDDLAVFWLGLQVFLRLSPPELVAHYRALIRGQGAAAPASDVVDAAYEVVDE